MNSAWNLEEIQVSLSNFGEQSLRICLKEPSVLISSFIFCHRSDCHSGCFDDKWRHRAPCHLCSITTMVTVSALIKLLNRGGHFKPVPHGGPFQIKEQWPVTQKLITCFPSSNVNTSTPTFGSRGASQTQQCAFFSPSTRVWWRAGGYISKPLWQRSLHIHALQTSWAQKRKHVSNTRKIKKMSVWLHVLWGAQLPSSKKRPYACCLPLHKHCYN